MPLFIPVLQGTTRKDRQSIHVAKLIAEIGAKMDDIETELVDPQELNLPLDGNDEAVKDPRYTEITKKADAFFIVTPEYNHSFPGSLKRMLDSELKNYIHKPAAIASVSSGPWGGVRAVESLVPVLRELGMVPTFAEVNVPKVGDVFDDDGNLQDEKFIKRIEKAYAELIWMAKTLKWGRENLESEHH